MAYSPGGYASHFFYKKDLELASGDYYLVRLIFRYLFLVRYKKAYGNLWCAYCGRRNLTIKSNNRLATTATLEHITPLVEGGDYYDLNNITIACSKCNNRRGSKNLDAQQILRLQHRQQVEQRLLRLRHHDAPTLDQLRADFASANLRHIIKRINVNPLKVPIKRVLEIKCPY